MNSHDGDAQARITADAVARRSTASSSLFSPLAPAMSPQRKTPSQRHSLPRSPIGRGMAVPKIPKPGS